MKIAITYQMMPTIVGTYKETEQETISTEDFASAIKRAKEHTYVGERFIIEGVAGELTSKGFVYYDILDRELLSEEQALSAMKETAQQAGAV